MSLSILHICNDFPYTKVHRNLYRELDKIGHCQLIFHPLRSNTVKGENTIDFKNMDSRIIYSPKIKSYHRLIFEAKTKFLYSSLVNQINPVEIKVVCATTLFSDGVLAYKLFKDYGIPYIVAVRNTDIHIFLKYRPDLMSLGRRILNDASKVIFISKSNYENFFNHKLVKGHPYFKEKSEIINNGVDNFWLVNQSTKSLKQVPSEILFIGKFDDNKNILNLLKAFEKLKKVRKEIKLNIVGAGGSNESKVLQLAKGNPSIKVYGKVTSKKELLQIFGKSHVFAMASYRETFGLVYVEALTQGLPILFTRKQGIDGTFEEDIGVSVNPSSVKGIYDGLHFILENFHRFEIPSIGRRDFGWDYVALKYHNILKNVKA
ncbi:glycosyltransferase family 4 protein [uncultured Christiangramia sp.]|uniref:glycosyltransferase family 4 protein n=1 Tax=uncultured Christiangramia sp. TaxID=503836 RepID=UPI00260A20CE|nr:glycosyltransferase family 4 protein [uncultured Christiangramia sp.]